MVSKPESTMTWVELPILIRLEPIRLLAISALETTGVCLINLSGNGSGEHYGMQNLMSGPGQGMQTELTN